MTINFAYSARYLRWIGSHNSTSIDNFRCVLLMSFKIMKRRKCESCFQFIVGMNQTSRISIRISLCLSLEKRKINYLEQQLRNLLANRTKKHFSFGKSHWMFSIMFWAICLMLLSIDLILLIGLATTFIYSDSLSASTQIYSVAIFFSFYSLKRIIANNTRNCV